eukprot:365640-Chlamydomonas_euryale.AAC.4
MGGGALLQGKKGAVRCGSARLCVSRLSAQARREAERGVAAAAVLRRGARFWAGCAWESRRGGCAGSLIMVRRRGRGCGWYDAIVSRCPTCTMHHVPRMLYGAVLALRVHGRRCRGRRARGRCGPDAPQAPSLVWFATARPPAVLGPADCRRDVVFFGERLATAFSASPIPFFATQAVVRAVIDEPRLSAARRRPVRGQPCAAAVGTLRRCCAPLASAAPAAAAAAAPPSVAAAAAATQALSRRQPMAPQLGASRGTATMPRPRAAMRRRAPPQRTGQLPRPLSSRPRRLRHVGEPGTHPFL